MQLSGERARATAGTARSRRLGISVFASAALLVPGAIPQAQIEAAPASGTAPASKVASASEAAPASEVAPASDAAPASRAPAFSAQALRAAPTDGWPTNGGNVYNQRYSPLDQIDRANVSRLRGVWRTHLEGSGLAPQYSGEAQPLVYDGVIYVSTGADDAFALSVETGRILWSYKANLDPSLTTVCCGWDNRGVALGDGKVFVGQLDGRLVALDQQTGKPVWSVQAERWQEGYSITSAPLYFEGKVVTGFSGAEFGIRGRVKAYDARDGKLLWTFYTVPGPGEEGHETWPGDSEVWKHGGGSVWQTPAADPELGLLYFSTGNPGPDFNGAVRAGNNLYTASIVAVDAETGRLRWHFQQVHHDIWDYDSPNPVVLFDARIGGRLRHALVQVSKTGWAYILDLETGEPLIGIDERAVPQEPGQETAATQPYPRGDAIVPHSVDIPPENFKLINEGRIFTPFLGDEGRIVNPSLYGGANWPPSSYDPERHSLFVCASDLPGNYIGGDRDFVIPPAGQTYEGGVVGFAPLPRTGIFAALDVTTNKLIWRYRWREQCYSGSVATAGGLVFVGRNDGRLTALDSDSGRQLWEFQTGAGVNAPASVFQYKGKEYVAVLSAGNVLIGSTHGDSVWLFGIDGGLAPVGAGDTPSEAGGVQVTSASVDPAARVADGAPAGGGAASSSPPSEGDEGADPDAGKAVYERTCVPCHGADGRGGHGGGAPLDRVTDAAAAMRTVTEGRNDMPAFGASLTKEEIRNVSSYIATRLFERDRGATDRPTARPTDRRRGGATGRRNRRIDGATEPTDRRTDRQTGRPADRHQPIDQ